MKSIEIKLEGKYPNCYSAWDKFREYDHDYGGYHTHSGVRVGKEAGIAIVENVVTGVEITGGGEFFKAIDSCNTIEECMAVHAKYFLDYAMSNIGVIEEIAKNAKEQGLREGKENQQAATLAVLGIYR